jgi:hydrogenase-4 membrane subunit HyfE
VLQRQNRPARNDVIPANMLSWAMVAVLLGLAFRGANWLHPAGGAEQLRVAVASAGVLFGLFVLATQNGAFGQAIGALRIENAIALFEVGRAAHEPLGLSVARAILFLATALAYAVYVERIAPALPPSPAAEESGAS